MFYTCVDQHFNDILFRGYNEGKRVHKKFRAADWQPTLFVPSIAESNYHDIKGRPISIVRPGSIGDCRRYIEKFQGTRHTVYGNSKWVIQFISDFFLSQCPWVREWINVLSIDIEVQSDKGFPRPEEANFPVTAITIKSSKDDTYYCWGLGDYDPALSKLGIKIQYVKCEDERELLLAFLKKFRKIDPDVITGWNSLKFDIHYVINRMLKIFSENTVFSISPWGILKYRQDGIGQWYYEIRGIQQLDYLELFKKFGHAYGTQASYKLNDVAHNVLGEGKLDYDDYGSLTTLYEQNHQKFIEYNIRDTQLIEKLEDKAGLITLALTIAYRARCNFFDVYSPVRTWDAILYNELRRRKIGVNPDKVSDKTHGIRGAHVKDPIPGMYNWVCSFDLNSLYPHLMMQYNMSPETIVDDTIADITVDKLLEHNELDFDKSRYCMSATGQLFEIKNKGIIPGLVEDLYAERSQQKKQMLGLIQELEGVSKNEKHQRIQLEKKISTLDNSQQSIKILMNALYGAMSNQYFRFFDIRIAESITVSGQLAIRWAEKEVNQHLNNELKTTDVDYVIAIDTDSLYLNLEELVQQAQPDEGEVKYLDKYCESILEPLHAKAYDELKTYMNAPVQKMVMAREIIANKAIWTSKKHYIANVINSEGVQYAEPKIKIVGIEAVRSSTPTACRQVIKDALKIILNEDEKATQKFIETQRDEFKKQDIEDISFPRGLNGSIKYADPVTLYKKATPMQVRAALLYNNLIDKLNITNKYEKLYDGNKLKFVYLIMPNPIHENVIGFPSVLPKEMQLHSFIDYDLQFDKAVIAPLTTILNAVGWNVEHKNTLKQFFI